MERINERIYRDHGYKDRGDYLKNLAYEYDVPISVVQAVADMLGPSEDFDGLISSLEDYHD